VPNLYRVFPYLPAAKPDGLGGALYASRRGGGRLDNPALYSILYLSDAAAGAIAEAFGRFPEWNAAMLEGSPSLAGSARAIARFQLPGVAPICNLDDPAQLAELRLRPSDVVSRDYARTAQWARKIYELRKWMGVRWWSYYDPQWASFGLWNIRQLKLVDVRLLRLDDADFQQAGRTIARRIVVGNG
jgi:hypothetical protein